MEVELQEISVSPDRPLLTEKSSDSDFNLIDCPYTQNGTVHRTQLRVTVQGERIRTHAMVTFHDVGLNAVSNYGPLMNSEAMSPVAQKYCIYHINAPGQEEDAIPLSTGFVYPSMENLSDMIAKVFAHFDLKSAVCIGSGAGANAFIRFALKNPSVVEGLILVNPTVSSMGNLSWIGEKIAEWLPYDTSDKAICILKRELIRAKKQHGIDGKGSLEPT